MTIIINIIQIVNNLFQLINFLLQKFGKSFIDGGILTILTNKSWVKNPSRIAVLNFEQFANDGEDERLNTAKQLTLFWKTLKIQYNFYTLQALKLFIDCCFSANTIIIIRAKSNSTFFHSAIIDTVFRQLLPYLPLFAY